jgi:tetratricopeptide (TPR) repeat protein
VRLGEYAEAAANIEEALQINRDLGFLLGEGYDHLMNGRIKHATGELDGALRDQINALELFRKIGSIYEPSALEGIARTHHARGELDLAAAALTEALALCETGHAPVLDIRVEVRNAVADLEFDTRGPARALPEYQAAAGLAIRGGVPLEHARAMEGMARCEFRLGLAEAALEHLSEAVDLYGRIGAAAYRPAVSYLAEVTSRR